MNWVFTNAVLLPLAALILAPLLAHLFARARPPVYRFSSVDLLRRAERQTVRLKRPRSFWVLLARTLLFAALVGVFLKPLFFGGYQAGGLGGAKRVVVLVDATASMAVTDATRTRLAVACDRATEILSGLAGNDLANIIWLGTPSRAEFPRLVANLPYLRKQLRAGAVTSETTEPSAALAMAAEMLREQTGSREIYILSDFQASQWKGQDLASPPGVQVYPIKIGREEAANQALTLLAASPARPLPGEDTVISCEVWNYSSASALNTVFLRAGESVQTREVPVPPWQKATVSFRVRFDSPGEKMITASLNEDSFPPDNTRWLRLETAPQVRAGLITTDPYPAVYWRRALEALEWVKLDLLSPQQLSEFPDEDALFLSGWNFETDLAPVAAYLARGGAVIWAPSLNTPAGRLASLASGAFPKPESPAPLLWEKASTPFRLLANSPDQPLFKLFADGLYGDPLRGMFQGRLKLSADIFPGSEPLLKYDDGQPALLLCRHTGSLLIWNLPLQRDQSDWALQPGFVPLLGEILTLYRRSSVMAGSPDLSTGQALTRLFDGEVLPADVRLEWNGQPVPLARSSARNQTLFASSEARQPGVYAWYYRDGLVAQQVVNFPEMESDLRTQNAVKTGAASPLVMSQTALTAWREGIPWWPQLLALAVLFMLAEGFLLVKADKL